MRLRPGIVALVAWGSAACGEESAVACDPGAAEPGVELVTSRGSGVWQERRIRPTWTELWRVGGSRPGEELAFPASVTASPDGRLAIYDFELAEVAVVSTDGRWEGPWTRRGAGPGELTYPIAASWTPEGDLLIADVMANKVVRLKDGEPVGSDLAVEGSFFGLVHMSGSFEWAAIAPDGTIFMITPRSMQGSTESGRETSHLLRLPPGAATADTLVRRTYAGATDRVDLPRVGEGKLSATMSAEGLLAVTDPYGSYRIHYFDREGRPVRRLCRAAAPLPLDPRERRSAEPAGGMERERTRAIERAGPVEPPDAVGRLFLGGRGRLWVQRDRPSVFRATEGLHGVPGAEFDVFESDGRYLGQVRAPEDARLQAAVGDTVFALTFGALDEPWIVAYRLELR